jgi:hypothetical protein
MAMSKLRYLRSCRRSYNRRMTLEEERRRNDTLRTEFKGGRVLMSTTLRTLPAQLRGQAIYQMTQYKAFHHDSDHGEGVFIWEGIIFRWFIEEFACQRTITLSLGNE